MFNAKKHHKKKKMVRILIWEGELWGIIMFVVFRQYQAGVFFCVWHSIRFFLHSPFFFYVVSGKAGWKKLFYLGNEIQSDVFFWFPPKFIVLHLLPCVNSCH